jgi:hypothetical protein
VRKQGRSLFPKFSLRRNSENERKKNLNDLVEKEEEIKEC